MAENETLIWLSEIYLEIIQLSKSKKEKLKNVRVRKKS